ncbi:MAG: sensor protein [Gemmatimonadetes bacterium]|jgi:PAS domain S-box-containing protein|nr:sensor protein [Gemmatimonadota bacterium]
MRDGPDESETDSGEPTASPHAERDAASFTSDQSRGTLSNEGSGLYRLLVESVRDYAIFALDREGHVLSWNPGAERFKGYKAHEIIGKHLSVFYPEEDKWKPALELKIAAAEGRFEEEGWRIRKDGTRFWANVVITALRDKTGALVGYAKVTRDLTERREAEAHALENARRAAVSDDANRAKAGFLAAMSHELRTPLNAIAGYADLLLLGVTGTLTEQQREYLQRIRGSQQHLLSIINDILNFSRIEAGQLQYDIAPVSLCAVVDAVVPMIEPQALSKNLRVDHTRSSDVFALGDRAKIEQILLNLLSNAVKFTDAGGRIEIACAGVGDRALLSVRDTGAGISAEHLGTIFQPFVQVGRSLTSPHEGTGLGLAISSDLAKGMAGTLEVRSKVDEGSIFTLRLPLSPPQ